MDMDSTKNFTMSVIERVYLLTRDDCVQRVADLNRGVWAGRVLSSLPVGRADCGAAVPDASRA